MKPFRSFWLHSTPSHPHDAGISLRARKRHRAHVLAVLEDEASHAVPTLALELPQLQTIDTRRDENAAAA